jgi:hypothetical protein
MRQIQVINQSSSNRPRLPQTFAKPAPPRVTLNERPKKPKKTQKNCKKLQKNPSGGDLEKTLTRDFRKTPQES